MNAVTGRFNELGLAAAVVVTTYVLVSAPLRPTLRRSWPVVALALWQLAATSWSVRPTLSFSFAARWAVLALFLVAFTTIASPEIQLRLLSLGVTGGLVGAAILSLFVPEIRGKAPNGAIGPYSHRNFLAHACGVLLVCAAGTFILRPKAWKQPFLAAVMAVVWILLSGSKTPLFAVAAALLAGGVLYGVSSGLFRRYKSVVGVGFFGLAVCATVGFRLLGAKPLDTTLTGRTSIWGALLPEVRRSWLSGYGSGQAFFFTPRRLIVSERVGRDVPHAHNGYLDALLNSGVVTLSLICILLAFGVLASLRWSVRSPRRGCVLLMLVVCAAGLNITEPDFLDSMPLTLFLATIAATHRRSALHLRATDYSHA